MPVPAAPRPPRHPTLRSRLIKATRATRPHRPLTINTHPRLLGIRYHCREGHEKCARPNRISKKPINRPRAQEQV